MPPRRAALFLALGALLFASALPVADAHEGGRRAFDRQDAGGVAFHLAVVSNVTRAGSEALLFLELRDAATHRLLPVEEVEGWARRVGSGMPASLPWVAEGEGRFRAGFVPDAAGAWTVEVRGAGAEAAFPVTVHAPSPVWADFRPSASLRPAPGEPAPLRLALVDHELGRPVAAPDDLVLHVERWDERHERRLGQATVRLAPAEAPWLLGAEHVFEAAGAYDLWVESASLGLTRESQPAFDVHVEAGEAHRAQGSAPVSTPPRAGGLAGLFAALGVVAGALLGARYRGPA